MPKKYIVIIEKAPANYSAYSPDVLGCIATGNTIDETLTEMKSALEFHLEGESSMPVPKGLDSYQNNPTFEKNPLDIIREIEID